MAGGSEGKVPACNAGDLCSIPESGWSPGEGNGNPLQYSCLENPMDGGAQWATVHGVTELDLTEQLTLSFPSATLSGELERTLKLFWGLEKRGIHPDL